MSGGVGERTGSTHLDSVLQCAFDIDQVPLDRVICRLELLVFGVLRILDQVVGYGEEDLWQGTSAINKRPKMVG